MTKLTDLKIRSAKPREKPYSVSAGDGLLLTIHPNGHKYWIVRARLNGREIRRSIGQYPDILITEARKKARAIQIDLASPQPQRPPEFTFSDIAQEWLNERMIPVCRESYIKAVRIRLNNIILPAFGEFKMTEITAPKILKLCREIENEGKLETAARVRQLMHQIFKYAIVTGRAESNPALALSGALLPHTTKHMAAILEPAAIGLLMRNIRAYPRKLISLAALFSIYTFARPGEIRHAEWHEIDLENALWSIPAEKMKMKRPHKVPLSRQAIAVLEQVRPLTHLQNWVFPSMRWNGRPISENTVRVALRSIGYTKDEITPHGFRAMASTLLNEQGWRSDLIEKQLAHEESNSVRAAYNHADYLPERRNMVQFWADYLDALADGRPLPERT